MHHVVNTTKSDVKGGKELIILQVQNGVNS